MTATRSIAFARRRILNNTSRSEWYGQCCWTLFGSHNFGNIQKILCLQWIDDGDDSVCCKYPVHQRFSQTFMQWEYTVWIVVVAAAAAAVTVQSNTNTHEAHIQVDGVRRLSFFYCRFKSKTRTQICICLLYPWSHTHTHNVRSFLYMLPDWLSCGLLTTARVKRHWLLESNKKRPPLRIDDELLLFIRSSLSLLFLN